MITKIIFSDGKIQFLDAADSMLCTQLKEARNDKGINDLLQQYEGRFELREASEAGEAMHTVDLHKKKLSSVKRMIRAFGGRR